MSGGFDAFDLGGLGGLGDITGFASDLGSVVTDFGSEFMSSFDITSFEVPTFDVASLGGFGEVGSFAGDASWFDTFNPGSILSSVPSVSDFNLSSLTSSLPSLSSIKNAAGAVGLPTTLGGIGTSISKLATNPAALSVASSITGVPPSLIASAAGVAGSSLTSASLPSLGSLASNPVAIATAASVSGVSPNLVNSAARAVDSTGLTILSNAETDALVAKTTLPGFVNSLVDPQAGTVNTYSEAVASQQELVASKQEYETAIAGFEREISNSNKNIEEMQANLQDPDLSDRQRALLEAQIQSNRDTIALNSDNLLSSRLTLDEINANLATDQQIIAQTNSSTVNSPSNVDTGTSNQYAFVKDTNGTYTIIDTTNGDTVQTGLTEQDAILAEQNLNINTPGIAATNNTTADDLLAQAIAANQATNVDTPGPTEADVLAAINGQTAALTNQARGQQSVRELRNNKAQSSDWRVRLRLAPNSNYLYNDPQPGILAALKLTDGVIFPYTPSIDTAYKANYDPYDLTHSNYRGYFYKGSYVDAINVRAQFTAQDSKEADYLLAVIHFFRSVTKMFYGQDAQRGSPPPLVYLNGYGDYQFSEHPCVVSQFNYTLPPDVDYIRAQNTLSVNTNQLNNRLRNPIANNPLAYSVNRLLNSSLTQGALFPRPSLPGSGSLANSSPTYVPTKMEIAITLYPMQSRSQISNNFSVKGFANGNLLKGGYW